MYEFVPEPCYVHPTGGALSEDQDEEEYDVYYYWPSRNEVALVYPPASLGPFRAPQRVEQRPVLFVDSDDDARSETTISDYSVIVSPTCSVDPGFAFADTVNDVGISSMGYSRFFRMGLWAQSARITKRGVALLEKTVARLHILQRYLGRQASSDNL
ncbi:hypothetical protein C8Q77DRAFT_397833 [Trametes polyzona]|nr:hypothetical protein C8Q77DRAFT_397833 [Trametes polyzona]